MKTSNKKNDFAVLKLVASLMPESAIRLGFTNGLMSESMVIWFAIMLIIEMTLQKAR